MVSAKFLYEYEHTSPLKEQLLETIIRSMKSFKLKVFPLASLEDTIYYLQRLAEIFQNCHELRLKQAFCELFTELISPLCSIVTAETNMPQWIKFVEIIYGKVAKMVVKPKYFHCSMPLTIVLLSISKKETFHQRFPNILEMCLQKLKDKAQRQMAFNSISLIVWIYLYKQQDSMTVTCQKLGALSRQLFPVGRKYIYPPNESSFDNFVDVIRYSGIKFIDFSLTNQVTKALLMYCLGNNRIIDVPQVTMASLTF